MLKHIALHPRFYNTGNNFVAVEDKNNQISVCKARFDPCEKGEKGSIINLERITPGFNKIEVIAGSDNSLSVCVVTKDSNHTPIIKKLDFPRNQLT